MKLFLLFLVIPLTNIAQTGIEIIKVSNARIKALKNITYNIYDENQSQKSTADVTIERDSSLPIFDARIKIAGLVITDNGSTPVSLSYNGNSFDFTDTKTKQIVSLDSPSYRKIGRTGMMPFTLLAIGPYWQREPFEPLFRQLIDAKRLSDTVIYNTKCYSVKVTIEINSEVMGKQINSSIWYFDKEKYLIRGHQSDLGRFFLTVKSINEEITPGIFDISATTEVKKINGLESFGDGLLQVGSKAPDWTLTTAENKTITLYKLKGKVVLLDFWGTWCVPCLRAMPEIQAIHEYFKNSQVEVLGISVETEKMTDPAGYAKKKGFTYTILLGGNKISKAYKVSEFPSVYLIDQNGNIIHAEHGGNRENFKEDIIAKIKSALSSKY